jgi:hypothetical protein
MYPRSAVGSVCSKNEPNEGAPRRHALRHTVTTCGWSPDRQLGVIFISSKKFNMGSTKGCAEATFCVMAVRCSDSRRRRDRSHRLFQTPAPFTSRSPGIATLGPSWTPSRQLNPCKDRTAKGWFRSGLVDVIRTGSCMARETPVGVEPTWSCFAGSRRAVWLQRHNLLQSPRQESNLVSNLRGVGCGSGTLQGQAEIGNLKSQTIRSYEIGKRKRTWKKREDASFPNSQF